MEEKKDSPEQSQSPEEIIKQNFPARLVRLQKQYKRLDVLAELSYWSEWITKWSKDIKKELTSDPEALYQFFKRRLKKSKPKLFRS